MRPTIMYMHLPFVSKLRSSSAAAQTHVLLKQGLQSPTLLKSNLLTHTSNIPDWHTMLATAEVRFVHSCSLQLTSSSVYQPSWPCMLCLSVQRDYLHSSGDSGDKGIQEMPHQKSPASTVFVCP